MIIGNSVSTAIKKKSRESLVSYMLITGAVANKFVQTSSRVIAFIGCPYSGNCKTIFGRPPHHMLKIESVRKGKGFLKYSDNKLMHINSKIIMQSPNISWLRGYKRYFTM